MRAFLRVALALSAILAFLLPSVAVATVTVFFDPSQVATLVGVGATSDTISCDGYLFAYTRDKLFTGGGTEPIGRPVRVSWPDGIEAQYVTAGPAPTKAQIVVRRLDGGVFDLTSFTARLLASAGAGRAIEIVPLLNGEEPLADPLYFDVSGSYGSEFSYDTSPNPFGSTATLVGYDTYKINLTLDYALTALTLTDPSAPSALSDPRMHAAAITVSPNPAGSRVLVSLNGSAPVVAGPVAVFSATGTRIRSLVLDAAGRTIWDLRDDLDRPVASGVYFVRIVSAARSSESRRVVVAR